MADISKVTIPSGTYDIKDATARNQIGNLATVATTGSYNDLSNKPTIPEYSSETAVSGGTDLSLVTTGEKYIWDNKQKVILTGTTDPESTLGSDGDIYIKYST